MRWITHERYIRRHSESYFFCWCRPPGCGWAQRDPRLRCTESSTFSRTDRKGSFLILKKCVSGSEFNSKCMPKRKHYTNFRWSFRSAGVSSQELKKFPSWKEQNFYDFIYTIIFFNRPNILNFYSSRVWIQIRIWIQRMNESRKPEYAVKLSRYQVGTSGTQVGRWPARSKSSNEKENLIG